MKYKAIYDAESDVPAELKQYYHLKDGKWVFNFAEFDGLAELSNPALNATKEDILQNKKDAEAARDDYKKKWEDTVKELNQLKKPDTIIITKTDNEAFEEYKKLGTVKDLSTKLQSGKSAEEKLKLFEDEKNIRILAKQVEVDPDALVDFKLNTVHGKDVVLEKEKRKVKNLRGKEEEKEVLVVVHTDEVNGEKKQRTELFSDYAKEKALPKYLVDGIFAAPQQVVDKKRENREFHLPETTRKKVSDDEGERKELSAKSFIANRNKSRGTRKLPWMKSTEKQEK